MILIFYTDNSNADHFYSIEEENLNNAISEIISSGISKEKILLCNYSQVLTFGEVEDELCIAN